MNEQTKSRLTDIGFHVRAGLDGGNKLKNDFGGNKLKNDFKIMARLNKIYPHLLSEEPTVDMLTHIYVLSSNLTGVFRELDLMNKYPESAVFDNKDLANPLVGMFVFFIGKDWSVTPQPISDRIIFETLEKRIVGDPIDVIKLRMCGVRWDEMAEDLAEKIRGVAHDTEIKACG